jgi:hypothetical protein
VERGEQGGNIKVTGLLHKEAAPLLPMSLKQLFQRLRLTGGVKDPSHRVGGHATDLPPTARERDPQERGVALGIVHGMCSHLVLYRKKGGISINRNTSKSEKNRKILSEQCTPFTIQVPMFSLPLFSFSLIK